MSKTPIYKEDIKEWFEDVLKITIAILFFALAGVGFIYCINAGINFFFP